MFKKYGIGMFALILAIGAAAFTTADRAAADPLYWFPTDASGNILSQTIDADDHLVKPCDEIGAYCAVGFTEDQVTDNGNGTVTLDPGLDKDDGVASQREN